MLLFLIAYAFTFSVYTPSKSAVMDVVNASIAIVNEDDSQAARALRDAMLPPLFLPAAADRLRRHQPRHGCRANTPSSWTCRRNSRRTWREDAKPDVQIITDATAMSQAGRGPGYIQRIITSTIEPFWSAPRQGRNNAPLVQLETRARFNPNMEQGWFVAINQVINNISVLAIFLTRRRGAARARARQHRAPAGHAAAPLSS